MLSSATMDSKMELLHRTQPGKRPDAVSGIATALKDDITLSVLVSDSEVLVNTSRNLAELCNRRSTEFRPSPTRLPLQPVSTFHPSTSGIPFPAV
ncbi:hypothetical protein BLNAU_8044 [Blattamonas nauphoetae]|uniref:Uncharacterized protein n=1 Tax=Blattamonas nauphoetae TaxID=2049346 RepID=A0ABQ9XZS8_9EUKA|nr:hypothetical protein BLNAU_8044 [Blattamonas nauphoetae]